MAENDGWISRTDAMKKFGCTEWFLRREGAHGRIRERREGKSFWVNLSDVARIALNIPDELLQEIRLYHLEHGQWPRLAPHYSEAPPDEYEKMEFLADVYAEVIRDEEYCDEQEPRRDTLPAKAPGMANVAERYFLGEMDELEREEIELCEFEPDMDLDDLYDDEESI